MAGERRWVLHVDMDAFFASVESLDHPELAGRPLIVGGAGRRGVVASCSYEARAYGVRSAMPSARARRLCPHAIFVAGRYERYAEVSRQMHEVLHRYTPLVEGISLDEAFLDVTGSVQLLGSPVEMAVDLRARIWSELGLRCSVGVATVKFLAKLASEAAKPVVTAPGGAGPMEADGDFSKPGRGIFVVAPGEELAFLHPLPIEALWGVGPATAARLRRLGMARVGDLAAVPPETLARAVGHAHGSHLAALARGLDDRSVQPTREVKSISHEETFAEDRRDPDELKTELLRLGDSVASRLRAGGLAGRTVGIKVRYGDFTTVTRSATSPGTLDTGPEIASLASALLDGVDVTPGVRLIGVGVSNLVPTGTAPPRQLALDLEGAAERGRRRPADATARTASAVDEVRRRFGSDSVGPASLLGPGGLRVKRPGDTQWGPSPGAPGGDDR